LENTIESLGNELLLTNRAMGDSATEVGALSSSIASASEQLSGLNSRLIALESARSSEVEEFDARQQRRNRLLNAVNVLIKRLSTLVLDGSVSLLQE
jgi:chromosome segregation ATPase